jgi:hypothetical protein
VQDVTEQREVKKGLRRAHGGVVARERDEDCEWNGVNQVLNGEVASWAKR